MDAAFSFTRFLAWAVIVIAVAAIGTVLYDAWKERQK
jgi:hypothetical protein